MQSLTFWMAEIYTDQKCTILLPKSKNVKIRIMEFGSQNPKSQKIGFWKLDAKIQKI